MMHELAGSGRVAAVWLGAAAWLAMGLGGCGGAAKTPRTQNPPAERSPARNQASQNQASQNQASQNQASQNQASQNPSGPVSVGEPQSATPGSGAEYGQTEQLEGGTADLTPGLAAGLMARYSVRVEGQEASEMTGSMAAKRDSTWDATLDVLVRIEPGSDGASQWTASISLDRVRATDYLDGRPMGYDSAEPAEKDPGNLVRPTIEALVGKRVEVDLDEHGNVVATRIPEELARRHNPSTRWTTRLLGDAEVRAFFGPIFSTGIASEIESAAASRDAARVGRTWRTTRQELFGSAEVATRITHTLAEAGAGSATISLEGASAITPNSAIGAGVQRITRDAYSGMTRWDVSRGLLAEHEVGRETQVQVRPDPEGFTILKIHLVQVRRVD